MVEGKGKEWQWGGATESLILCLLALSLPGEKGKEKKMKRN
jgi:hypothetical protein